MLRRGVLPRGVLWRGVLGSVLVLLGGLVVSVVPDSSWVSDHDLLVVLRTTEAGRMVGLAVVMGGLGLLAHSWLALCREVARARADHAGGLALTRLAVVSWSVPLLPAPPLFSRDGWSYAAQGWLAHSGISPYRNGPGVLRGEIVEAVDPRWMHTPTPYGPVPVGLGEALARVLADPWALVVAHRLVALVGLVLLAWAVPRTARWTGVSPALASALVLASPLVLANGVGGLHNDLLMVGLMAAALVVAVERSWVHGALLAGLAAGVKAPGGLVCLAIALVTLPAAAPLLARARRLLSVGLVAVGVLLATGVLTGTGTGWVHALSVPGSVRTVLSVTTLLGGALDWSAQLVGLGTGPATFLDLVRLLGTVVSLAVMAWVAVRWPTGRRDAALSAMALVAGTVVVLSPVVHLWYFLWVPPFLATQRLSRVSATRLIGLSVVLGLVAPLDSSLHGAYLAIVLTTLLAVVLVQVLLLTPGARERVRRVAAPRWVATLDPPTPAPTRPTPTTHP